MVGWSLKFSKQALKHSKKIKAAGLEDKVDEILDLLETDPFTPYPRYEALEHDKKGQYSRRINLQHRLVYLVDEEKRVVTVVGMFGHYE